MARERDIESIAVLLYSQEHDDPFGITWRAHPEIRAEYVRRVRAMQPDAAPRRQTREET